MVTFMRGEILDHEATVLGILLWRYVPQYFQDAQHRKEFEEWHLKTYGEPYVWKGAQQ